MPAHVCKVAFMPAHHHARAGLGFYARGWEEVDV